MLEFWLVIVKKWLGFFQIGYVCISMRYFIIIVFVSSGPFLVFPNQYSESSGFLLHFWLVFFQKDDLNHAVDSLFFVLVSCVYPRARGP